MARKWQEVVQREASVSAKQKAGQLSLAMRLEEDWRRGRDYQRAMGFSSNWTEYEQMKVGQQWPTAGSRTKHLPRPVFNMVDLVINHKTAQILNENIRMIFNAETTEENSPLAQAAAEYYSALADETWAHISQAMLNEQVLDAAATYGVGIWHYYWDNGSIGGGSRKYCGALAGETLDPANCFFGNPQLPEVQKQPWILIAKREELGTVQARAAAHGLNAAVFSPDRRNMDSLNEAARTEIADSGKLTVLTQYSRGADGRICFAQSAGGQLLTPLTSLGLTRYPLEVMNWKLRKSCIYGMGEVEGIIPNQKAINFIMAMMMLSVQDTAWPKLVAKPGALSQQLTNMPGEVVLDNYPAGEGIRYLTGAPLSASALGLVDKVYELTRSIGGANQVATGEIISSSMSGAAIIALQRASGIPVEQIKKRFLRSLVNVGRIWEDFFRCKYHMERTVAVAAEQGGRKLLSCTATDYAQVPLTLKIDVGAAADYSEALMMANIESFLVQGHITFEEALEFMPDAAVPFRKELLRRIHARRAQEVGLQEAALQEAALQEAALQEASLQEASLQEAALATAVLEQAARGFAGGLS